VGLEVMCVPYRELIGKAHRISLLYVKNTEPNESAFYWDGSKPEWVLVETVSDDPSKTQLIPGNKITSHILHSGNPAFLDAIVKKMLEASIEIILMDDFCKIFTNGSSDINLN
jgi:hypothetical protein